MKRMELVGLALGASIVVSCQTNPSNDAVVRRSAVVTCAEDAAVPSTAVDVIVAVDTSASMEFHRQAFMVAINELAAALGNAQIDYRVIAVAFGGPVVGGGVSSFCPPPPLGRSGCRDNPPRFFGRSGTDPSRLLTSLLGSFNHTDPTRRWKDLLRPDAKKVFVALSDDDERGSPTAETFDASLRAEAPELFESGGQRSYIFDSIVMTAPDTTFCLGGDGIGTRYMELSALTGGVVQDVCRAEYGAPLVEIANHTANLFPCLPPPPPPPPEPDAGTDADSCPTDLASCTAALSEARGAADLCNTNLEQRTSELAARTSELAAQTAALAQCQSGASQCQSDLGQAQAALAVCNAALASCSDSRLDSDGDGEPDARDRCPNTPSGAAIDDAGCSLEEFCSRYSGVHAAQIARCFAADWANDEPESILPHDCRPKKVNGSHQCRPDE